MPDMDVCFTWCPGGHDGSCEVTVGELAGGFLVNLYGNRNEEVQQEIYIDEAEFDSAMAAVLGAVVAGNLPRIGAVHAQYEDTEWTHVSWCRREHDEEEPCDAALLHTEGGTQFYLECNRDDYPVVAVRVTGIPRPNYPDQARELRLGYDDLVDLQQHLPAALGLMAEAAQPAPPPPPPDAKVDKLKLAKRIRLTGGQYLIASDLFDTRIEYNNEVLLALIGGPAGAQLCLGIIHPTDRRRWTAQPVIQPDDGEDDGSAVTLDAAGVAQLDAGLDAMAAAARAIRERLIEILLRVETIPDEDYGYKTQWMTPWESGSMSAEQFHHHAKTGYRFADSVTEEQKAAVFELHDYAGTPQALALLATGPWGSLLYQITPNEECGSEDAAVKVEIVVQPADAPEDWKINEVTDYDRQLRLLESDIPKLRSKIEQFWSRQ